MFSLLAIPFSLALISLAKCDPSVIIIGAGPAGIAAATKLLENSVKNITILEAENRIGGRINSVKFGDAFVDLGAEYCHGEAGNIVYELAKPFNLLARSYKNALFYSNGSRISPNFAEELQAVILGYDVSNVTVNASQRSLKSVFEEKFAATLLRKYASDGNKIKVLNEALGLAERVTLMIDGGFSWIDTSAVKHYERCDGHQLLVWQGRGYNTILDILMKSFPNPEKKLEIDDKFLLGRKVEKISWNSTQVLVRTNNETFSADYVIFTPSVGVLQEHHEEIFNPKLPERKQQALQALGIGGVMKIIMHFQSQWWQDEKILTFLWSKEDLDNSSKEFPYGPATKSGASWVSAITIFVNVPGNPNVLTGWVTGELVPEIEQLSVETLRDGCIYVIKKFFGKSFNVTAPDQILKTGWRSNPNFRGTYSYERAGFDRVNVSYQRDLAEPLRGIGGRPVVLFAGEATNPIHYSTVHGAIETGHREAERILALRKIF